MLGQPELSKELTLQVVESSGPGNHSCHKCGSQLKRTKGVGRFCSLCNIHFHATDCGVRYAHAGVDSSLLAVCPKCSKSCLCADGPVMCHAGNLRLKRKRNRRPDGIEEEEAGPAAKARSTELPQLEAEAVSDTQNNETVCQEVQLPKAEGPAVAADGRREMSQASAAAATPGYPGIDPADGLSNYLMMGSLLSRILSSMQRLEGTVSDLRRKVQALEAISKKGDESGSLPARDRSGPSDIVESLQLASQLPPVGTGSWNNRVTEMTTIQQSILNQLRPGSSLSEAASTSMPGTGRASSGLAGQRVMAERVRCAALQHRPEGPHSSAGPASTRVLDSSTGSILDEMVLSDSDFLDILLSQHAISRRSGMAGPVMESAEIVLVPQLHCTSFMSAYADPETNRLANKVLRLSTALFFLHSTNTVLITAVTVALDAFQLSGLVSFIMQELGALFFAVLVLHLGVEAIRKRNPACLFYFSQLSWYILLNAVQLATAAVRLTVDLFAIWKYGMHYWHASVDRQAGADGSFSQDEYEGMLEDMYLQAYAHIQAERLQVATQLPPGEALPQGALDPALTDPSQEAPSDHHHHRRLSTLHRAKDSTSFQGRLTDIMTGRNNHVISESGAPAEEVTAVVAVDSDELLTGFQAYSDSFTARAAAAGHLHSDFSSTPGDNFHCALTIWDMVCTAGLVVLLLWIIKNSWKLRKLLKQQAKPQPPREPPPAGAAQDVDGRRVGWQADEAPAMEPPSHVEVDVAVEDARDPIKLAKLKRVTQLLATHVELQRQAGSLQENVRLLGGEAV